MSEVFGFRQGQLYSRREDIHNRFRGQEQGGIITPKDKKVVFIISGDGGAKYGYHDRLRPDGVLEYYGEGQRGDMRFTRGNLAIRQHRENGKPILLFDMLNGALRFSGPVRYSGHRIERGLDRDGAWRDVIVFLLENDSI